MNRVSALLGGVAICCAVALQPAFAEDGENAKKIAGAIAILGIAAMLHDKHHYREGYEPGSEVEYADFERGYRDGLHNNRYDTRWATQAYSEGFSAGQHERDARLSHHDNRQAGYNIGAPGAAVSSCAREAANQWGTSHSNVHPTKVRQAASNDFYIELTAGRHTGVCEVSKDGQIYLFQPSARISN